ncbi:MAG: hypothetical protein HN472_08055 [Nitrospina sp.]|jgi:hypothetical protein|nr:hypothetical protein [Nitrospina sp.]MBT3509481.1 hypothetical protein [Nitrospina sp.]
MHLPVPKQQVLKESADNLKRIAVRLTELAESNCHPPSEVESEIRQISDTAYLLNKLMQN